MTNRSSRSRHSRTLGSLVPLSGNTRNPPQRSRLSGWRQLLATETALHLPPPVRCLNHRSDRSHAPCGSGHLLWKLGGCRIAGRLDAGFVTAAAATTELRTDNVEPNNCQSREITMGHDVLRDNLQRFSALEVPLELSLLRYPTTVTLKDVMSWRSSEEG